MRTAAPSAEGGKHFIVRQSARSGQIVRHTCVAVTVAVTVPMAAKSVRGI